MGETVIFRGGQPGGRVSLIASSGGRSSGIRHLLQRSVAQHWMRLAGGQRAEYKVQVIGISEPSYLGEYYSETSDKGHSELKRTNLPTKDKPKVLSYTYSIL